jgi:leucyl-tRNA synthetase
MAASYDPKKIEKKWQKYWAAKKLFVAKDADTQRENYMLLTEFPYPSGNLHIGHWYAFALPDVRARYLRMNGKNVMYPIGFDAFGLPAENAAIKRDISPEKWTKQNIAYMTKQLQSMGASFDWSRVISTIDSEYYRWTQWMFLKMYEKGLAYRAKTLVNWCPKDKTVLANEQVVTRSTSSGQASCCERCETQVVQKELAQWMLRITDYADRLIDDLEPLDWPETTKVAQRNWIGRSEGALIRFKIADSDETLDVFTTRADTLFGCTYVVLAPEHQLVTKITDDKHLDRVTAYVEASRKKSELERTHLDKEKTGEPTGAYAVNPVNGEKVPVWVADYVLGHYGTGAVMAVPAHDERDFAFAKKYNLPIVQTIGKDQFDEPAEMEEAFVEDGYVIGKTVYDGLSSADAREKIVRDLAAKNMASPKKNYRLHDWVLSRQRYWGVPIPMVKCASCGYVPVPEKELPVQLPPLKDFKPSDDGRSPLAKATKWLKVTCPTCNSPAERETDTMDTFVDSSWYYLRYTDPKNKKKFADEKKMAAWLPVPMYLGGSEHNTMHLLYSRFYAKALYDLGYVSFSEPFLSRHNRGIILGPDGQKMSKSRGNVVDPDDLVERFGADTVRMYLAFMAPYEQGGPWDPKGINGVYRFLHRVWRLVTSTTQPAQESSRVIDGAFHRAIKKIGKDIDTLAFNTAVSELMKLLNAAEAYSASERALSSWHLAAFLTLLAPFAPHIAEELWQGVLKKKKSIHLEPWPQYDPALLIEDTLHLPVQVNGKVRDSIDVPSDVSEEEIKTRALASTKVQSHIAGKTIKKIIIIPRRLISIVV